MRINGVYWYLGPFPFRFEFWDENWNPSVFGWLLAILRIKKRQDDSPELRGVEFDIGRAMRDGDTIGDCRPLRLTEAQLNGDLKALGLTSHDVRHLASSIERECRRHKVTDPDDWRTKTALYLREQENDLLFKEVCATNPGRAVSMNGAGIMIG